MPLIGTASSRHAIDADWSFVQGQNGANTFTRWMEALHMADVGGWPYRIAVALVGLLVTLSAVTEVLIWNRKRQARVEVKARRHGVTW